MSVAAAKLMTFEEYAPIYGDQRYELVEGVPTEIPMPEGDHGYVAMNFGGELRNFVKDRKLGRVTGVDNFVMTKRKPDTVRGADVSYYSFESLPAEHKLPGRKNAYILPDLIAEVNSPSDRKNKIAVKVEEYLQAGVGIVIVLDPDILSATVYRRNELPQVFDNGDTLSFPDLLPGFGVAVKSLFE